MKKGNPVRFSEHALAKLDVLAAHGWRLDTDQIEAVVKEPDRIEEGYKGRKIAQRGIGTGHVLRVVFEELPDGILNRDHVSWAKGEV